MHSIKRAIIIPFILFAVFFLGSSLVWVHSNSQEFDKLHMQTLTTDVSRTLANGIARDTEVLEAALAAIAIDQSLKSAFLNNDRDELYDLSRDLFHELRNSHNISHFYFSNIDKVNFLRVHQPDRHSDTINRFTTRTTEKTQNTSAGIELGPLGTYTLRVVAPWRYRGKVIGYLELGKEINTVFADVPKLLGGSSFVFIQKRNLNRANWESGMKMLKRTPNWDKFDDVILTDSTFNPPPAALLRALENVSYTEDLLTRETTKEGRILTIVGYPLVSVTKKEIGYFALAIDETALVSQSNRYILLFTLGSLGGVVVMIWLFWLILARAEKRLTKAMDERAESEERLSSHMENTPVGVIAWNSNFECTQWNPAAEKIFGFSQEEALGINALKLLVPEEIHDQVDIIFTALMKQKGGDHSINENVTRDGRTILCEWFNSPLTSKDGTSIGVASIVRDITLEKEQEKSLRKAKEEAEQLNRELFKLSQAVEQSPATVVITDPNGNIEYVNAKFEQTTGYTFDEALGQNPRILTSGEKGQEEYKDLWETITSGNEWRGEFHNRRKDGSLYWEAASISPIREPDGRITHFLALKEDITALKKSDEKLRRAQKMEIIGQLTGGIAHDFNNILGIVMGNLEIVKLLIAGNEKAVERVEIALKGTRRGANITRKLLNFSRKGAYGVSQTSVNTLIENQTEFMARSLTASVKVETRLADDLWLVAINPGDFEDALLNLSLNARDAMIDGGTLLIETANKVLDDQYVKFNPESEIGEYVMISVSDNGVGMTTETLNKVLEPFFTTKDPGTGTGLGLSMVSGFVQRSGGHLDISSEVGEGTAIRLYLPRARERTLDDNVSGAANADLPHGKETILIVDDEKELLDIASVYLEALGYKTLQSTSGKQALKVLENNQDIDLLFSDVVMPGDLDGYQLTLAARQDRPALKTLLASGYIKDDIGKLDGEPESQSRLKANLLRKPYSQRELAVAIRNTLDTEK